MIEPGFKFRSDSMPLLYHISQLGKKEKRQIYVLGIKSCLGFIAAMEKRELVGDKAVKFLIVRNWSSG